MESGIRTGFGDEWIRFGATSEHTVDGSFSERNMALKTPYPESNPPYKGNVTETQQDLDAWVERVHRASIQVNGHANGAVAIDMVLTALERAQRLFPVADARPEITHCTLINDDLIRRMKAADAVPVHVVCVLQFRQVPSLRRRADGTVDSLPHLPRCQIPATAGSDFSPGPFAPLIGIQGMVDADRVERADLGSEPAGQRGARSRVRCASGTLSS